MHIRPIKFASIGEGRRAKEFALACPKRLGTIRVEVGHFVNPDDEDCMIRQIQSHDLASFVGQATPEELAALGEVLTQLFVKARKRKPH